MKRVLAIVVLLTIGPTMAGADVPQVSGGNAPAVYVKVPWRNEDGSLSDGYWYTAEQVVVVSQRIRYLEEKAAKECVDAQVDAARRTSVWWQIGIGVLAGATIGYCAGAPHHCGLSK